MSNTVKNERGYTFLKNIIIFALGVGVGLLAGVVIASHSDTPAPVAQVAPPQTQQQPVVQAPAPQPQLDGHIAELEQKALSEPQNRAVWVSLGNHYYDAGKAQQAISAYQHALDLNAQDAGVWTDMGVMYRALGQFEKAVECFRKAGEVQPGHTPSLFNLGLVLNFDLHRHAEARQAWENLLKVEPNATAPNGTAVRELIKTIPTE